MIARAIAVALLVAAAATAGVAAENANRAITFRIEPSPADLRAAFTAEQVALLEKINRADANYLPRQSVIVVPEEWDAGELAYSPLPSAVPEFAELHKALLVHVPGQVFGAYEHGSLVRWGPVSSGRQQHPTPAGRYHLNWRARARHSTVDPRWYMEWYFNFHNSRGLALHQYALPGRPASHACVRLLERDARWLFDWGESWRLASGRVVEHGTPLWIVGKYDFAADPPWLEPSAPHPVLTFDLPGAAN